jgi:hypothetical protein
MSPPHSYGPDCEECEGFCLQLAKLARECGGIRGGGFDAVKTWDFTESGLTKFARALAAVPAAAQEPHPWTPEELAYAAKHAPDALPIEHKLVAALRAANDALLGLNADTSYRMPAELRAQIDDALQSPTSAAQEPCRHGVTIPAHCMACSDSAQEPNRVIPPAPPECETDAEKTAYAFGYWQGLHAARAALQSPTSAAQEPSALRYDVLYEIAATFSLDYNEVCKVARSVQEPTARMGAAVAAARRAAPTAVPAEPADDEHDLDPRVALSYARQIKDYCESFNDRDWASVSLFGSVDEKNLATALDNLTECAAMLMNMADRVKRRAAPTAAAIPAETAALTDEQIKQQIMIHGSGGWQSFADMTRFARAIERECRAAAPGAAPSEAPKPVAYPEGFRLLPVEATDAMMDADWDVSMSEAHTNGGVSVAAWRAMVEAAPQVTCGNGHSGFGWYMHDTDYPEEGAVFLGPVATPPASLPVGGEGETADKENGNG